MAWGGAAWLGMFMWVLNDSPEAKEALGVGTRMSPSEYVGAGSRYSAPNFPPGIVG